MVCFCVTENVLLRFIFLFQFLTEILKLKEILKNLNDAHSETSNYVSGAHGILSLIQGARSREVVRSGNKASFIISLKVIKMHKIKMFIKCSLKFTNIYCKACWPSLKMWDTGHHKSICGNLLLVIERGEIIWKNWILFIEIQNLIK